MSYVYFIQAKSGQIKIGWSVNPRKRAASIQTGSPEEHTVLGCVPGDRSVEQALHVAFRSLRQKGEWFAPGEALLAYIAAEAQPVPAVVGEVRPPRDALGYDDLAARTIRALENEYGTGNGAFKACARAIGVSVRTAQNWFSGKVHGIPWGNVVRLLRRSDHFLDEFLITPDRVYWFTDKFRPRHLMILVNVASEDDYRKIFAHVKAIGDARRVTLKAGGDCSALDAELAELAKFADSCRVRAA